eukprot:TRINITY_DN2988_c3_g1_i1.p1 TRINITY_DN2988_c3_g1~~TRINITY_DN2988_c3_g1_i1.p1  ORF type:complete len:790 (+),score=229.32 TRINITY_DN2988_c3_g1_i1:199-2568(+)
MGAGESRARFEASVKILGSKRVDELEDSQRETVWDSLLQHYIPLEELTTVVPTIVLRDIRDNHPDNFGRLVEECTSHLEAVCASSNPPGQYRSDKTHILSCAQWLTYLIPVSMEPLSRKIWEKKYFVKKPDSESSLAVRIVNVIYRLLFLPGFSVSKTSPPTSNPQHAQTPKKKDGDKTKHVGDEEVLKHSFRTFNPDLIWANGVGIRSGAQHLDRTYDENRIHILRLLLALIHDGLYIERDGINPLLTRWMKAIVSPENPHCADFLFSLLNVVASYDPRNTIPYSGSIISVSHREKLVEICVHAMNALMLCPCSEHHPIGTHRGRVELDDNVFVHILAAMNVKEDSVFVVGGIVRLLMHSINCQKTYLPGSMRNITFFRPLYFTLWGIALSNRAFFNTYLQQHESLDLLYVLLYGLQESAPVLKHKTLGEMCIYLLLISSENRDFCALLNTPFNRTLPIYVPPFTGNHGDLLVLMIVRAMFGPKWIGEVYMPLLMTMANIGLHVKKFALVTARKVLHLFHAVSRPKYLDAAQHHHHIPVLLMHFFSNAILHHWEGNSDLVQQIIENRIDFEQIAVLPDLPESMRAKKGGEEEDVGEDEKGKEELEDERPANMTPEEELKAMKEKEEREKRDKQEKLELEAEAERILFVRDWKAKLPIGPILAILQLFAPRLNACYDDRGNLEREKLKKMIEETSMVGVLPPAGHVVVHRYHPIRTVDASVQLAMAVEFVALCHSWAVFDIDIIRIEAEEEVEDDDEEEEEEEKEEKEKGHSVDHVNEKEKEKEHSDAK